ncbi:metal-dependent hydrolase [Secundilactobacillus pentosiphilus]|uniref:Metal-dependent hydrolase n=1 Tax=Secundilactobacillus pentosiphilus TaxID=1714682 RepID=A0A1Z5IUI9_9LACO|nr:MBL fold metallo-hydrolase [Secundilactobacillus pentosiphilus]GAX05415.1 metal-dependent hydrolase [Secundilactobacillus pentosiphilus]
MIDVKIIGSGSSGNCYVIDDGKTQLIIEAGVAFKHVQVAMDFDFSRLAGVLISHEHGDHSKYLPALREHVSAPIFMTTGTAKALKQTLFYSPIKSLDPFAAGTWKIIPFEVKHDAREPVGFMIENQLGERLLYVTDTYFVKYKFRDIKYMVVEMNYLNTIAMENERKGNLNHGLRNRILTSHFEMSNSLAFIQANESDKLESVTLIHLSEKNSDEQLFKRRTQAVTGVPVYVAPQKSW